MKCQAHRAISVPVTLNEHAAERSSCSKQGFRRQHWSRRVTTLQIVCTPLIAAIILSRTKVGDYGPIGLYTPRSFLPSPHFPHLQHLTRPALSPSSFAATCRFRSRCPPLICSQRLGAARVALHYTCTNQSYSLSPNPLAQKALRFTQKGSLATSGCFASIIAKISTSDHGFSSLYTPPPSNCGTTEWEPLLTASKNTMDLYEASTSTRHNHSLSLAVTTTRSKFGPIKRADACSR